MNWSEIETSWVQMRPLLTSKWAMFTEADITAVDGKRDRLARLLRERYNFSDHEAEHAISSFEKDCRFPGRVK